MAIKTDVSIEYVKYLKSELARINKIPLENIQWESFGEEVKVSDETIKEFSFTGLNNVDFIMSGYYLKNKDE